MPGGVASTMSSAADNKDSSSRRRARRTALILGAVAVGFYVLAFVSVSVFHALY